MALGHSNDSDISRFNLIPSEILTASSDSLIAAMLDELHSISNYWLKAVILRVFFLMYFKLPFSCSVMTLALLTEIFLFFASFCRK